MIKKNTLLLNVSLIIFIIFLFPDDYKYLIPYGDKIINILSIIMLFVCYLCNFKRIISFIKSNIIFLFPFIITLISTIINKNEIMIALSNLIIALIIYYIAAMFKDNKNKIIKVSEKISFIILLLNVLYMLIFKEPSRYTDTGGRIYFIFDGSIGKLLIANMLLFFIKNEFIDKRQVILHYIVYLLSIYNILFSVTNSVGCILLFIGLLLSNKNKNINRIFSISKFIIIISLIFDALVVFGKVSLFLSIIFNKSVTLSGRTIIWKQAINIIKSNLLIGIGIFNSKFFINLTNVSGATHAHNQILQILLNCGLIGFLPYIYYIKKLFLIRFINIKNSPLKYYYIYLVIIVLMCTTNNLFDNFFYLSLLIATNYLKYLKKDSDSK